jgi:hypothetical protein
MDEQILQQLVGVKGALKVITAEIRMDLRADPTDPRSGPKPGIDWDSLRTRHDSFVIHDVTRLVGPDAEGIYRAHTAEGDWCVGTPSALLSRLQEWRG